MARDFLLAGAGCRPIEWPDTYDRPVSTYFDVQAGVMSYIKSLRKRTWAIDRASVSVRLG